METARQINLEPTYLPVCFQLQVCSNILYSASCITNASSIFREDNQDVPYRILGPHSVCCFLLQAKKQKVVISPRYRVRRKDRNRQVGGPTFTAFAETLQFSHLHQKLIDKAYAHWMTNNIETNECRLELIETRRYIICTYSGSC